MPAFFFRNLTLSNRKMQVPLQTLHRSNRNRLSVIKNMLFVTVIRITEGESVKITELKQSKFTLVKISL